ncbi:MAG: RidA family protein [Terrimicrobiaceae bacterium]
MNQYLNNIEGLPVSSSPYSSGIIAEGKFLFISGQLPYDPALGRIVRGSIAGQTTLTLECLKRVIAEAGASIDDVVSCRVYLQQLTESNFAEMNGAYAAFFANTKPTRTTIGCQLLNVDVEIDCVVRMG